MHLAARKGCEKVCGMLTSLESSLEQKFRRNNDKDTPLIVAARCGNRKCCKYLSSGEIINLYNKDRDTALHCTTRKGLYSTVEFLLDMGADPRITNKSGNIPVFDAAGLQSSKTLQVILEKDKNFFTDEYDIFSRGRTLLHIIALNDSTDCLNYLNDNTEAHEFLIRTKNVQDEDGNTPLHLALKKKNVEIAEKLIEMGCNFNENNNKKQTAIHIAAQNNLGRICNIIGSKPKFRFMVNNCDEDGANILHLGAAAKNVECCRLAIKKGIQIRVVDKSGKTALHLAAEVGDPGICKLLNHKVLLQTKDDMKNTPLHLAAKNGHLESTKILFRAAKNVMHFTNRDNKTPLDVAFDNKSDEIFNYLLHNTTVISDDKSRDPVISSTTLHRYMHEAIKNERR